MPQTQHCYGCNTLWCLYDPNGLRESWCHAKRPDTEAISKQTKVNCLHLFFIHSPSLLKYIRKDKVLFSFYFPLFILFLLRLLFIPLLLLRIFHSFTSHFSFFFLFFSFYLFSFFFFFFHFSLFILLLLHLIFLPRLLLIFILHFLLIFLTFFSSSHFSIFFYFLRSAYFFFSFLFFIQSSFNVILFISLRQIFHLIFECLGFYEFIFSSFLHFYLFIYLILPSWFFLFISSIFTSPFSGIIPLKKFHQ